MNIILIDSDYIFCDRLVDYFKNNGNFKILETFDDAQKAVVFINENKNIINLIILCLDIQNIDLVLNTILDEKSKNCNVIVLSEFTETLEKHINNPYFQKVFKKPLAFSNLLNYICIQNKIDTFENCKRKVLKSLSNLNFNINHAGTTYLAESTALALKNNLKKLSDINTLVAYNHNTDPKIIGWSINNAINKAVKISEPNKLNNFFNIQDSQKLTAKYIINYFIHYYDSGEF